MNGPRIASLFTGTGMLDEAVKDVYGGETVWYSQYEPPGKNGKEDTNQYAAKILERHWPGVPNLGDITKVDWQAVLDEHGQVDVLTGGFPCQDVSSAGRRAGLTPDSRSGLWAHMARAISVLRPRLVVIENVEGLLSARASGNVEPCPYCVGDGPAEHPLRACGAVLGDLASLGLDAEWSRFGADEVGAPHRRRRIIILAWPAAQDADVESGDERRLAAPGQAEEGGHGPTLADEVEHLLPTPAARDWKSGESNLMDRNARPLNEVVVNLLPTPTASNPNDGESLESWEARRQRNLAKGINGNGQGTPLGIAVKLLPTPMAGDAKGTRNATAGRTTDNPNVNPGWTLSDVVFSGQLLPTPTTSDGERTFSVYGRGNPTLTGAVTDPPSDGGKPSSDDESLGPLMLWDD